jgi:hypothetical protein
MRWLWIAGVLFAGVASAAPTDAERALATQLFKEAKALMADGKYAAACPKLAESQRLDPGGGTILNLALCREEEGRTATAWTLFHEALAYAKRDGRTDRRELAEQHIASLEPKLPRVQLAVAGDVTIAIDKVSVARAAWDAPIPVDPGDHTIEANAAGKLPFSIAISAAAGETKKVEIPALEDAPTPPPPPAPPPAPIVAPPPPKPVDISHASYTPAFIATGVSVLAFAATGYFSLRATSARSEKPGAPATMSACAAAPKPASPTTSARRTSPTWGRSPSPSALPRSRRRWCSSRCHRGRTPASRSVRQARASRSTSDRRAARVSAVQPTPVLKKQAPSASA